MATQPDPDTINPGAPPEVPSEPSPAESPVNDPPGVTPPAPDVDNPDPGPIETPPPDRSD